MITIRAFQTEDAIELAQVVKTTLLISNSRDYSEEFIKENIASHSSERLIEKPRMVTFSLLVKTVKSWGAAVSSAIGEALQKAIS